MKIPLSFFLQNIENKTIQENLIALNTNKIFQHIIHSMKNGRLHSNICGEMNFVTLPDIPLLKFETSHSFRFSRKHPITIYNGKQLNYLLLKFSFPSVGKMEGFKLKVIQGIDLNQSNERILFLDRNLDYRLTLNKFTYSKTFMIGSDPEDSDQSLRTRHPGERIGAG